MSRTTRNYRPGRVRYDKPFIDVLERGLISIPKLEPFGIDEIWGQAGKKHRKKVLRRAARRDSKSCTKEQYDA